MMITNSLIAGKRKGWAVVLACMCAVMFVADTPAKASERSAAKSATLKPVTYLSPRVGAVLSLELGRKMGFFKKEGIDLKLNVDLPPAQYLANLLSGQAQFALLSWGALLPAAANGAPVSVIGQMTTNGSPTRRDDTQLVALASSSIRTGADLKGKTVAVPTLNGQPEVAVRNYARVAGVDQKTLKMSQINFSDMGAALRAGRVDAAVITEPFIAALKAQTQIRLLAGQSEMLIGRGGIPTTMTFVTKAYLAANKSTVDAFRRAQTRSVAYARANPKKIIALYPSVTGVSAAVAAKTIPTTYDDKIDFKALSRYVTIAFNFGKLAKKINPRSIAVLK